VAALEIFPEYKVLPLLNLLFALIVTVDPVCGKLVVVYKTAVSGN
jgi:hypothetical protein